MIFWWLTVCFSFSTISNLMSRVLLCLIVTKPSFNTTDLPLDSTTLGDTLLDLNVNDNPEGFVNNTESFVAGVYDYESSINFDNYLQELGVSYILRQLAPLASPIVTISPDVTCPGKLKSENCEHWSIKTDTLFLQHVVKFKLGDPGRDVTMDGREISFVIKRLDTNKWHEEQSSLSGPKKYTTYLLREFFADKMVVTLSVNNVTSKSIFTRRMTDLDDEFS